MLSSQNVLHEEALSPRTSLFGEFFQKLIPGAIYMIHQCHRKIDGFLGHRSVLLQEPNRFRVIGAGSQHQCAIAAFI